MRALFPLLLGAQLAGCCFCPIGGRELTPEERAAAEQQRAQRAAQEAAERQAALARAVPRARSLDRVAALIDPSAAVPVVACPDDEIEAARGGFRITSIFTPTVDYGSLPGVTPPTAPEWRWLVNSEGQRYFTVREQGEAAPEHLRERVGGVDHRWLAVFVTRERTLPRVTRPASLLREGEWAPGDYRGGVYVVDLDAMRVICSTPFHAESSDQLLDDDDLEADILEDFQEAVEREATEELQEHTVHFNLNLVGIL